VGFIRDRFGRITIEERSESFIVHPVYGYDASGNAWDDGLGSFGVYWREHPHPEFLLDDLDDLIAALVDLRGARVKVVA
jgi:hypothetical protein